jgi:hypothetical protein
LGCRERVSTNRPNQVAKLPTGPISWQPKGATEMEPHFVITVLFILLTTVLA